jgi:hypothetical protein
MGALGLISGLAQSHRYRVELLQVWGNPLFSQYLLILFTKVASEIGVSDDPVLRDVLHKDEAYIFQALNRISQSEADQKAVLRLQGDDARCFLNLIQMVLALSSTSVEQLTLFDFRCWIEDTIATKVLAAKLIVC